MKQVLTKYDFAPDWLVQDANEVRHLIHQRIPDVDEMIKEVVDGNFDGDVRRAAGKLMDIKEVGPVSAGEIMFKVFLAVAGARQADEVF